MQLHSNLPPPYLPDEKQTTVLRLGITPLVMADWIQPDADFADFHRHKLDAFDRHASKVAVALPESAACQQQFANYLCNHLVSEHPTTYTTAGDTLNHKPSGLNWSLSAQSLQSCCLWIPDDICLLERHEGEYRLTAASVCSPSNWNLEEKLGQNLVAIHGPVPGYEKELAQRVDRLLSGLKPTKPVRRINWSIQRGNELLWRSDLAAADIAEPLYWRVEQQSLLRLPESDAIIFSIRIFLHSFAVLEKLPNFHKHLEIILARLPHEQIHYKGLSDLSPRFN